MRKMIPAAAYYRMSSDQQEGSIEGQRAAVQKYAEQHGYVIVREYLDEGRPGWKDDRKGFQRLIKDAATGEFSAVLCWDQDRFSRFPVLEANHYWFLLDRAGVHIATVGQGRLDFASLAGWLTASLAQHGKSEYCRDLARNTTRGLRKRKLAGEWVGMAPYGFEIGDDGHLVLGCAAEIAAVRRIFAMRKAGHGAWSIAKYLNETGVETPRGRQWSTRAVQHILQRDAYIGTVVIGKWSRAKYQRLTDGVVEIAGAHPAIIDRPTWDAVQAMWQTKRLSHGDKDGGGALAGLLHCGRCGGPMYHVMHVGHPKRTHYLCGTRAKGGGCKSCQVNADQVLAIVAEKIRASFLLGTPERLAAEIGRRLEVKAAVAVDVDGLRRQLASIDGKIANATERLVTVSASLVAAVEGKLLDLQRQREIVAAQLAAKPAAKAIDPRDVAAELWTIDQTLRTGTPGELRRTLARFVQQIRVDFEYVTTTGRGERWRPIGGSIQFTTEGLPSGTWSPVMVSRVRLTRDDFRRAA